MHRGESVLNPRCDTTSEEKHQEADNYSSSNVPDIHVDVVLDSWLQHSPGLTATDFMGRVNQWMEDLSFPHS